jgi:tRNA pseudouridine55 synthase
MNHATPDDGRMLLINKPREWTSFDVVNKLRNILKTRKIGHAGTLDPLATGLLIVCVGKMTKQIESFMGMEKEYSGTIVVGQTTPSYDLETPVSEAKDVSGISVKDLHDTAKSFIGEIDQLPPAHSAIRIGGKRAYDLARKGKEVDLPRRRVTISAFEITSIAMPAVNFKIICSKGTYIRSVAHDFGEALGVGAYLAALCRTRIGDFKLEDALTMDEAGVLRNG